MDLWEYEGQKQLPVVTVILVGINVLAFIVTEIIGPYLGAVDLTDAGAMYAPAVIYGHEWYRLVTHFFLHWSVSHLTNNMVSLFVLGYALENVVGRIWFLAIYMFSGVFAGLISMWYDLSHGQEAISCGASGAIFGLMGALLVMLLVISRGTIQRYISRYMLYIILAIYSGATDPGIDNTAHVGGFFGGAILCAILCIRNQAHRKGD